MAGGSTLGNISNTQVPMKTVDIGLAQLAMHSVYETTGAKDTESLAKAAQYCLHKQRRTAHEQKYREKSSIFDADGTLCDMEKGVPASTKEALKKLRENGHEAWLCTGRSRAFVSWYLEELPFTGMISACGATIEKMESACLIKK